MGLNSQVAIFLLLAILFSPFASADITTGLVGYWKFDENTGSVAADSSGNHNNGTLVGGSVWQAGYTNSDLNFDGGNDYIRSPTVSFINAQNTPHSMFAWVYPKSARGAVNNYGEFSDNLHSTGICINTQILCWINGYGANGVKSSGLTVQLNEWSFVGFVRTATQVIFYVNGTTATINASDNAAISTNPFTIGVASLNGARLDYFSGSIDEVRIYNRVLTAGDANQLYYCQPPTTAGTNWIIDGNTNCDLEQVLNPIDVNLAGYWKFDEGRGTVAKDSSGNGNNGTLTGGPTRQIGKFGGDLNFDGVDDYVVTNSFNLPNTFTVSAWVKPASQPANYLRIAETSYANGFYLGLDTTDDPGYKWIVNNPTSPFGTAEGGTLTFGAWTHVVGTYNGTTGVLYVNGVNVGSDTFNDPGSDTNVVTIGRNNPLAMEYFNGEIDDVRIYKRALSATDVNNLYKDTKTVVLGNNLDIRDGTLNVPSSYTLTAQSGKKIFIRRTAANTDQKLIIQRLGRLILKK